MHRPPHMESARDDRGATTTEYALLVSLIALSIIAMVWAVGTNLSGVYVRSCDDLVTATSGTTC
jgi:Flp pilus assembly pilin Flp